MAPQILAIAGFLSITWGVYLIGTIKLYHDAQTGKAKIQTHEQQLVVAMRRFIVAFCTWLFVFSFVFRTGWVLLGLGEDTVSQIVFFTLLGSNVLGSIYCIISLRYD